MFNAFNMCTKDFSLIAENRVFGNSFHEKEIYVILDGFQNQNVKMLFTVNLLQRQEVKCHRNMIVCSNGM